LVKRRLDAPADTAIKLFVDGLRAELTGFVARRDVTAMLIKLEPSDAEVRR